MGAGRGRRTGIILIVLILVVVLIVVGGLFLMQSLGGGGGGQPAANNTPPTVPPPTAPPTINVIIAARDIPRGARLSAGDVTVMPWPILDQAPPPIDALVVSDQTGGPGLDQVDGRIARVDILNGEPIMNFMLTPGDQPTSLADMGSDAALLIPSGMVAVAMPITRLSSVAYALREGDHVDLMMSFRFIMVDETTQTELPNTGILLTNDPEVVALGLQNIQIPVGQEERGVFGTTMLVVPNENGQKAVQQTTQLVIKNAIVVRMGTWPLDNLHQPIVITPAPPPTPSEGGTPEPTAAATNVPSLPIPDIITLAMTRQDALVLKYATETGGIIDLALRSALDDDVNDVTTDPVTLGYIMNFYNVTAPEQLPVALDPRIDMLSTITQAGAAETPAAPTSSGQQTNQP